MIRSHPRLAWLAAGLFALAALFCVPLGLEAESLLVGRRRSGGDRRPRACARLRRHRRRPRNRGGARRQRRRSRPELCRSRRRPRRGAAAGVEESASQAAVDEANSASAAAGSFASGLITGEPKDMAGLAGTALGDLFVFGDIRDAVREGSRYASGESYDQLILGLSVVGIAITAGTYATVGAATPARLGLTAVKAARKTGRLSARLADWIGRSLRDVVDWSALKRAGAAVTEPAVAVRAAREAVKVEKADGLVRLVSDVGRVQTKAGTQAALDGLKLAEGPREMSRVAALAEKKGSKTRAILKTLGRGAILLSIASFNLAAWVLGAILTLFGFVSSAKAGGRARDAAASRPQEGARRPQRYAMMAQSRA